MKLATMDEIKLGSTYRIKGKTIVVTYLNVSFGGRKIKMNVEGYRPDLYEDYQKFNIVEDNPPFRTHAEIFGTKVPSKTKITFGPKTKVYEVSE